MKSKNLSISELLMYIIIFVLLTITPLIIKLCIVTNATSQQIYFGVNSSDFFVYGKSIVILCISIILFLSFSINYFVTLEYGFDLKEKFKNPLFIGCALIIFFALLSFLFSPYKDLVLKGSATRYESIFIFIGYIFTMLVVLDFSKDKFRKEMVLFSLTLAAFFIGFIGIFQFIQYCTTAGKTGNYDLVLFDFLKKIYLGKYYDQYGKVINLTMNSVYSTLFNPNYMGLYGALYIPIGISSFLAYSKKSFMKYFSLITIILMVFSTIGSKSSAGIIALTCSLFIFLIIYGIYTRKYNKKISNIVFTTIVLLIIVPIGIVLTVPKFSDLSQKAYNKLVHINSDGYPTLDATSDTVIVKSNNEVQKIKFIDENGTIEFSDENDKVFYSTKYTDLQNFVDNSNKMNKEYQQKNNTNKLITSDKITIVSPKNKKIYLGMNSSYVNYKTDQLNINFIPYNGKIAFGGYGENPVYLDDKIPTFGFKNHEDFGSGRGYIWSRSIPIAFKSIFVGSGNDTFVMKFPQNDLSGKIKVFGNPTIIVDKVHNMYLQYIINTGFFSLVGLLIVVIYCLVLLFKKLFSEEQNRFNKFFIIGIITSILSYMICGMSDDQNLLVAPTFWAIIGLGYAFSKGDIIIKALENNVKKYKK